MPILTAGVSGGVAVTNQPNGVSLSLVNDYGFVIISNAAPQQGPDTQGVLTISPGLAGGYTGSPVVAFEKVISSQDFTANNWTALLGVVPRTGSTQLASNTFTLAANQSVDFTLPSVQGFYAVRARLAVIPTSGILVVSGSTFAGVAGALNPAEQALLNQLNFLQFAETIASCDQTSSDYMQMAQGASYP